MNSVGMSRRDAIASPARLRVRRPSAGKRWSRSAVSRSAGGVGIAGASLDDRLEGHPHVLECMLEPDLEPGEIAGARIAAREPHRLAPDPSECTCPRGLANEPPDGIDLERLREVAKRTELERGRGRLHVGLA